MVKNNDRTAINFYLLEHQIPALKQILDNNMFATRSILIARFIDHFSKLSLEEADAVFQKAKDENLYAEQDKKYSSAFVPTNLKRFIDDTSNERGLGKAEILTIIIWHFLKEKRLEL